MLSPTEETEVYQRLDQIVKDMKVLDIHDIAFYLVRYEPDMAKDLQETLEVQFTKQRGQLYNDY